MVGRWLAEVADLALYAGPDWPVATAAGVRACARPDEMHAAAAASLAPIPFY